MEFRIERSALTDAVSWAARVLPVRSPVPVLGGLLLETGGEGGPLRISGLDYEASARIDVDAGVTRPGKVLVMGRRLLDICKVLPEGPVECAVEGSRFTVSGDGARFGLSVLPLDDYPALPRSRGSGARWTRSCSRRPWPRWRWPRAATTRCPRSPGSGWGSTATR